jgi:hypothetical protein
MAPERKPEGWFKVLKRLAWENKDGLRDRLERRNREKTQAETRLRLWASERCSFTANILSRQSRLHLVSLANRLEVGRGERVRKLTTELPRGLVQEIHAVQLALKDACKGQEMPPLNLKELSMKSFDDIAFCFKDQVAITQSLKRLEEIMLLRFELEAPENAYFIPLACATSCFTRHISGYEDRLLTTQMVLKDNQVFNERPPTPPRIPTPPSEIKRE